MQDLEDVRWIQRFSNFNKALQTLTDAVSFAGQRPLSELER